VGELIADLYDAVADLNGHAGIQTSLRVKLDAASARLADGNPATDRVAAGILRAFILHVEAVRGHQVTGTDADLLVALAEAAIDTLNS
jgi:hypothetical protein